MKIGIGLPTMIPGVDGPLIVEWAKKADAGPFSTLAVLDRLIYSNHDPLASLAAAAAVTSRIRLMTTVLIAPFRNTGVLAKQAATIDVLSNGRLTLGLAVGSRQEDYAFDPPSFRTRGKRLGEQLSLLRRIWSGDRLSDDIGPIGPPPVQPGGPEILIGGRTPAALGRGAEWIDGYISGGGELEKAREGYRLAEEAWKAARRNGKPRFVGAIYCSVGEEDRAKGFLRDYYAFRGPGADAMAALVSTTAAAIQEKIRAFSDIGADELVLWPCFADLRQIDRIAEAAGIA